MPAVPPGEGGGLGQLFLYGSAMAGTLLCLCCVRVCLNRRKAQQQQQRGRPPPNKGGASKGGSSSAAPQKPALTGGPAQKPGLTGGPAQKPGLTGGIGRPGIGAGAAGGKQPMPAAGAGKQPMPAAGAGKHPIPARQPPPAAGVVPRQDPRSRNASDGAGVIPSSLQPRSRNASDGPGPFKPPAGGLGYNTAAAGSQSARAGSGSGAGCGISPLERAAALQKGAPRPGYQPAGAAASSGAASARAALPSQPNRAPIPNTAIGNAARGVPPSRPLPPGRR